MSYLSKLRIMSKISISGCISDLLFERNSIVLPGIGLFETKLKESAIDQVQGMIHPPSKEILFNSNVSGDDGVLVDFIKRKYGAEELSARTALAEFTNDLRLRIHRKEIIAIPDVGRLYLDFEKNLQFLPDRVNYNKDAFGLPSLNYYPVLQDEQTPPPVVIPPPVVSKPPQPTQPKKEEPPIAKPAPTPVSTPAATPIPVVQRPTPTVPPVSEPPKVTPATPAPAESSTPKPIVPVPSIPTAPVKADVPKTVIPNPPTDGYPPQDNVFVDFFAKAAPFILVFALLFVSYIFYKYLIADQGNTLPEEDVIEKIDGRVNRSPRAEDGDAIYEDDIMDQTNEGMTYEDEDISEEVEFEEDIQEEIDFEEETPEEIEESAYEEPEEREYIQPSRRRGSGENGIIIIGGFSSARNAQKLVEKIQKKGYSPFTDAKGKLTRVGVEFSFDSVSELDDMHRQIKREFNRSAWILEPKMD